MQKSNFLQDLGYVEGAEGACCILHAMLQGSAKYPMSKASKETKTHIIDQNYMFISYVKDAEGSVHNINTFNGMHVRGVKGSFNLHCGF